MLLPAKNSHLKVYVYIMFLCVNSLTSLLDLANPYLNLFLSSFCHFYIAVSFVSLKKKKLILIVTCINNITCTQNRLSSCIAKAILLQPTPDLVVILDIKFLTSHTYFTGILQEQHTD